MALTVAGATASTYTIIDIIGDMGDDPGSGWDVAGVTNGTKDHTLVRKSSVRSGNTNWTTSAGTNATDSEWIVEAKDTWTYVGSHAIPNLNQYYIKVVGYSSTGTIGAYLLTVAETAFNANHGTLVINEIHYNPATGLEFVELYNTGSTAIDMSGYTWSGITSTIATGTSIAAGGYFLADSLTAASLSDSGEKLELKDSTGALVDEVTYDDASPWPTGADGGGSSLELINAFNRLLELACSFAMRTPP